MANKIVPQTLNSSGVYDKLITAISSGGTGAESESAAVKNLISGLTSTSPTSDDLIPFQDVSSGGAGKTTLSALASTLQSVRGYAKIQTGSYVGTGTYGADNPCSLTFNFSIQLFVLIYREYSNVCDLLIDGFSSQSMNTFVFTKFLSSSFSSTHSFLSFSAGKYGFDCDIKINRNKTNLQWYNFQSANNQFNSDSCTYYYFCLG